MSVKTGSGLVIRSNNASGVRNGNFVGIGVRPQGYEYPVGLSSILETTAIANAATNTTGGTQTVEGDNVFHTFTTTDDFVPSFDGNVNVLIVAGGGGGHAMEPGGGGQAGGGAGGVVIKENHPVSNNPYTITIGAGGLGNAGQGSNTTFGTPDNLVAWGGGQGGPAPGISRDGGSQGGQYGGANNALLQTNNPSLPADSRTYGYGNYGGNNSGGPSFAAGGGGGAGGAGGGTTTSSPGGSGGAGLLTTNFSWLSPVTTFSPTSNRFASGGGSGSRVGNAGATAGGGGGINTNGTANRGGGAGGHTAPGPEIPPAPAGTPKGGSGIAIVRFTKSQSVTSITGYQIN